LTSTLEGSEWSASRPGRFTPRERALCSHWIGGWVGPNRFEFLPAILSFFHNFPVSANARLVHWIFHYCLRSPLWSSHHLVRCYIICSV